MHPNNTMASVQDATETRTFLGFGFELAHPRIRQPCRHISLRQQSHDYYAAPVPLSKAAQAQQLRPQMSPMVLIAG